MYPNYNLNQRKRTPIYAWGKRRPVGNVIGNEFRKSIASNGFLREPPAICFGIETLKAAERAGALWLVVFDKDTGVTYRAPIVKVWREGFPLNRNFGSQRGLLISEWDVIEPAPVPVQMELAL